MKRRNFLKLSAAAALTGMAAACGAAPSASASSAPAASSAASTPGGPVGQRFLCAGGEFRSQYAGQLCRFQCGGFQRRGDGPHPCGLLFRHRPHRRGGRVHC